MGDGPAVLKGFVEGLYTWFCACMDHARKPCVCSLGSNSAHGESKLSARGVQTQHAVPPPAVHCPPTPNATCLARSPHHRAALVAFALARRQSPSPHACLARSPHGGWGGRWWVHDGGYMTSGWGDSTRQTMAVTE